MFQSGVVYLDVAIGLAVAFFVLSLIPSGINEFIAFITRIRSKFLWAYLNQLFTRAEDGDDDATTNEASQNARRFVPETVVRALPATGDGADAEVSEPEASTPVPAAIHTGNGSARGLPVSSRGFVRLMVASQSADPRPRIQAPVGTSTLSFVDQLHRQLGPITVASSLTLGSKAEKDRKRTTTKHIPPGSLAQAIVELLSADIATSDANEIDVAVRAQIDRLSGTPIHATLLTQWAAAKGDLERFGDRLSLLLDAEMARLSGLYKRLSRWILGAAALLVALLVNLDPVGLTRDLWRDPDRRAEFVAFGADADDDAASAGSADAGDANTGPELQDLYRACRNSTTSTTSTTPAGTTPTTERAAVTAGSTVAPETGGSVATTTTGPETANEPTVDGAAAAVDQLRSCVTDALDAQSELGLVNDSVWEWERFEKTWGWSFDASIVHVAKLLMVAGAIFFGAPFWWDVVRRLMGIRKSVVKHET